jgi:hypothetical protein
VLNLAIQKISETEKKAWLNRKSHPVYFDYTAGKKEGYSIKTEKNITRIKGSDASGLMYGCLEFASQLAKLKAYPKKLDISDAPEMVLRGQCIGLQKSTYLQGRNCL